ncbi:hypothetical protein Tco_0809876 [Tanacetum coccineum]
MLAGKVYERAGEEFKVLSAPKLMSSDGSVVCSVISVRSYAFDDYEVNVSGEDNRKLLLNKGVGLQDVTHPNDMCINKDLSFTSAIDKNATRVSSVNCLLEKMWHHALLSPNCAKRLRLLVVRHVVVSDNVCCNVNRVRKLRWDPLLKYVSRIDDVGLNKSNSLVLKIQQQLADGHYVAATSSCSDLE